MGCWGTHWQESDTYLDIYNIALEPITKILDKKHSNDWVKKREVDIVSASGLLLDITENKELYYKTEKELIGKAIKHIEKVLKLCLSERDLKKKCHTTWEKPKQRKEDVLKLLAKLKERYNEKERYTTLGTQIKKNRKGGCLY